jgi:hypothetical protein
MLTRGPAHRKTIIVWTIIGAMAPTYVSLVFPYIGFSVPEGIGLILMVLSSPALALGHFPITGLPELSVVALVITINAVFYGAMGWIGWIILQKLKAAVRDGSSMLRHHKPVILNEDRTTRLLYYK